MADCQEQQGHIINIDYENKTHLMLIVFCICKYVQDLSHPKRVLAFQELLQFLQLRSLVRNINKGVEVTKRVAAESSISVVSSRLLSLVTSSCLDESLCSGFVGLHFVSCLNESVENRLFAENKPAGGLE